MGSRYAHLSAEERGVIMVMRSQRSSTPVHTHKQRK